MFLGISSHHEFPLAGAGHAGLSIHSRFTCMCASLLLLSRRLAFHVLRRRSADSMSVPSDLITASAQQPHRRHPLSSPPPPSHCVRVSARVTQSHSSLPTSVSSSVSLPLSLSLSPPACLCDVEPDLFRPYKFASCRRRRHVNPDRAVQLGIAAGGR